ncbi:MAG: hypothetical protein HYZ31_12030, partial [Gammaproteobacteria bacterium]|nr:hypothetical protein [Gammaproteobacteria bacterium]
MKQIIAYWIHKLGLTGLAPLVPLSPVQFTSVFADVLQTSLPQPSVTIKGDLEIAISTADGKESTIYLDNAYTQ